MDAALAVTGTKYCAPRFHGNYEFDPEPIPFYRGMTVIKEGRTTGYTEGVIFSVGFNLPRVPYAGGLYADFVDQILIQASNGWRFSDHGDSGSLVLGLEGGVYHPVGLLFSGDGGQWTWANPIQEVFNQLNIGFLQYDPEA